MIDMNDMLTMDADAYAKATPKSIREYLDQAGDAMFRLDDCDLDADVDDDDGGADDGEDEEEEGGGNGAGGLRLPVVGSFEFMARQRLPRHYQHHGP